jgi:hypothetical protein
MSNGYALNSFAPRAFICAVEDMEEKEEKGRRGKRKKRKRRSLRRRWSRERRKGIIEGERKRKSRRRN